MKIIEVIYPEFQNVYADLYQIEVLKKSNKDIKVVYTNYNDTPYFVSSNVDMIYIGSMPDSKIIPTIEKLKPYKELLKKMIENNILFLICGNAIEIFSSYIMTDNIKYEGLNIFDYYVLKDLNKKYRSWYIGKYDDLHIIGHKGMFSICKNITNNFIDTINGYSSDIESKNEGIHYKNFYGTYLLGPLLIMNPYFTKKILKKLDLNDNLIYEQELINAYNERIKHFLNPNARFEMKDHG